MDVVCLGELLVDMFPVEVGRPLQEVSAFRPMPGGAPANVAVAVARLGARSAFIGKVGDEPFGRHLARTLAREGVDVRGVRYDPNVRTTMAFIAQPDVNSYDIVFYRNPGADTMLLPEEIDGQLLREGRALHFGSLGLTDEPSRSATLWAVETAVHSGALISLDVNYRPRLWEGPECARREVLSILGRVDVLKVNEGELSLLTGCSDPGEGSRALSGMGPALVIVTMGPQGSYFRCAAGEGHVPGFAVDAVDATGSGDAFAAGLLTALLAADCWRNALVPDQLRGILRYANAAGALTTLRQGVIPALPTAAEVEAFLALRARAD